MLVWWALVWKGSRSATEEKGEYNLCEWDKGIGPLRAHTHHEPWVRAWGTPTLTSKQRWEKSKPRTKTTDSENMSPFRSRSGADRIHGIGPSCNERASSIATYASSRHQARVLHHTKVAQTTLSHSMPLQSANILEDWMIPVTLCVFRTGHVDYCTR